jgi:hypothetical protein
VYNVDVESTPRKIVEVKGLTATGSPSAVLLPNYNVEIVVRGTDGHIYLAVLPYPFSPDVTITQVSDVPSATDPVIFTRASGQQVHIVTR